MRLIYLTKLLEHNFKTNSFNSIFFWDHSVNLCHYKIKSRISKDIRPFKTKIKEITLQYLQKYNLQHLER